MENAPDEGLHSFYRSSNIIRVIKSIKLRWIGHVYKGVQKRHTGPRNWTDNLDHNEELHSLYRSPNIARVIKSRRLRWAGNVARMEEGRSAFKILTNKPTGKRPLGRPMCR